MKRKKRGEKEGCAYASVSGDEPRKRNKGVPARVPGEKRKKERMPHTQSLQACAAFGA
jgi:hypothetical protein